jgi:hypothetical protein
VVWVLLYLECAGLSLEYCVLLYIGPLHAR